MLELTAAQSASFHGMEWAVRQTLTALRTTVIMCTAV